MTITVPPSNPSTASVPARTLVRPVKAELSPARTVEPEPICSIAPAPEITPPKVSASERSKANTPALATSPTIEPVVPPAPSCKVPPLIRVPPA